MLSHFSQVKMILHRDFLQGKLTGLLFLILTISCTGPEHMKTSKDTASALAPEGSNALLVIIRNGFMGSPLKMYNYLDGNFISDAVYKKYSISKVQPGFHAVSSMVDFSRLITTEIINFEAGKIYYLSLSMYNSGERPNSLGAADRAFIMTSFGVGAVGAIGGLSGRQDQKARFKWVSEIEARDLMAKDSYMIPDSKRPGDDLPVQAKNVILAKLQEAVNNK